MFAYDYTTLKLYFRFRFYERFTRLSLIRKSTGVDNFNNKAAGPGACSEQFILSQLAAFDDYGVDSANVELKKSGLQS